jgi:uncharacterized protein YndB with AHSA1/START domain
MPAENQKEHSQNEHPDDKFSGRILTLTRILNAPRELVFKVWTDPRHFAKWWGPKNFTAPVCEFDAVPGGSIHVLMKGNDGYENDLDGTFHEIIEPEKLVFTITGFKDKNGIPKIENYFTVTFTEKDGKTEMKLHVEVKKIAPELEFALAGMKEGTSQSLDKLIELVYELKLNKN